MWYKQGDKLNNNKNLTTMKTYFVKTQTSVNEHLLHSTMQKEFSTTDINEAYAMFSKEVERLHKEYKTMEELEYCPSDNEQNHAVYCSIIAIDSEDTDEVEFIEDSEYFYE